MKNDKKFEINLLRLDNKTHVFNYKIDDAFFAGLDQDLLEKGKIDVEVTLDKREALVDVTVDFSGYVALICDRSLKEFEFPMEFEFKVFLKYGDTTKELDDNLIQINYDHPVFDVGGLIFDLLALQIPVKKIHPDHQDADDDDVEEEELFFTTREEEEEADENEKDGTDPRWNELLKLKNKNN